MAEVSGDTGREPERAVAASSRMFAAISDFPSHLRTEATSLLFALEAEDLKRQVRIYAPRDLPPERRSSSARSFSLKRMVNGLVLTGFFGKTGSPWSWIEVFCLNLSVTFSGVGGMHLAYSGQNFSKALVIFAISFARYEGMFNNVSSFRLRIIPNSIRTDGIVAVLSTAKGTS